MKRYAIYYAPRPGAFAARAAAWLGWDAEAGVPVAPPELPGVADAASLAPGARRYGFHGTLRAPFRPAAELRAADIMREVAALAARLPAVQCDGLDLVDLDGFLAFVPRGDAGPLNALAEAVVRGTDGLRSPLSAEERARRRPELLTDRQRDLMDRWGYPLVMDEFRFHLTLTDRLDRAEVPAVQSALGAYFAPVLPVPFVVQDLCLFGEEEGGQFHLLARNPLTG